MPRTIPCPDCDRKYGDPDALAQHRKSTHLNPDWAPSASKKLVPMCPSCGKPAVLTATQHGPRAACCGLYSWGYGRLVDPETHAARNAAHAAFDPLWQHRTLDRSEAYRRLGAVMGLSTGECHIARMDAAQAARVVEIVRAGLLLEMA